MSTRVCRSGSRKPCAALSLPRKPAALLRPSIDNALAKPLPVVIGTVAPEQLDRLKAQVTSSVLKLMQSEETMAGITRYINDTLAKLRPHSIDAILPSFTPTPKRNSNRCSPAALLDILTREETSNIINDMLAAQIDRLLSKPIGRFGDHIPEGKAPRAAPQASPTR